MIVKKNYYPANIYLLKVNNIKTRKRCKICSKLTIKTPDWRRSGVFIAALNIFHTFFWCFDCWLRTSKCELGTISWWRHHLNLTGLNLTSVCCHNLVNRVIEFYQNYTNYNEDVIILQTSLNWIGAFESSCCSSLVTLVSISIFLYIYIYIYIYI